MSDQGPEHRLPVKKATKNMGQVGITGSLLWTAPAFNQLPLVALYYF